MEEMTWAAPRPYRGAWHGDPDVKMTAVIGMKAHAAADQFVQGSYVLADDTRESGWRGCFLGCLVAEMVAAERRVPVLALQMGAGLSFGDGWREEAQRLWGLPEPLTRMVESIYESLPTITEATRFAVDVVEAIPVGADLSDSPLWRQGLSVSELLDKIRSAPLVAVSTG